MWHTCNLKPTRTAIYHNLSQWVIAVRVPGGQFAGVPSPRVHVRHYGCDRQSGRRLHHNTLLGDRGTTNHQLRRSGRRDALQSAVHRPELKEEYDYHRHVHAGGYDDAALGENHEKTN